MHVVSAIVLKCFIIIVVKLILCLIQQVIHIVLSLLHYKRLSHEKMVSSTSTIDW